MLSLPKRRTCYSSSYPSLDRSGRRQPKASLSRNGAIKLKYQISKPSGQTVHIAEPSEAFEPEELFVEPPFKGLQFFDEADADLFFGREALTARLLIRLGIPQGGRSEGDNLLVIVGASGSGKSSLVRAGLVPAVRYAACRWTDLARAQTPAWEIVVITPTAHPLEVLATRLTREVESVTAAATLMDDMRNDPRSLRLYPA